MPSSEFRDHLWLSDPHTMSHNTHVLKVSKNVGITSTTPAMYHGFWPIDHFLFVLSIKNPTVTVANPSAIWPDNNENDALDAPKPMGYVKKYSKYMNHQVAQKSL